MKIDCVAITHNGVVRPNNEDCILCDGWMRNSPMDEPIGFSSSAGSPRLRVFAVADGLGGHSSGEVASQFALARLCSAVADLATVSEDSIADLVQDTHKALFVVSGADPSYRGMGSTVAGLVVDPAGAVYLFHVGDSRIYRRQERFLELVTSDDRLESARYGEADPESRSNSSLLQCLGGLSEFSKITPHVARFDIADVPETFLLCTDGVSDILTQDEIEETLSESHEQTVRTLFERVRNAGAKDNVSIVIVGISPELRPREIPVVSPAISGLPGGQP